MSAPDGVALVRVFYGTDRNRTGTKRYGRDRDILRYGQCVVSIPRDHRLGELEGPSIWKLQFRPDPEKHVHLMDVSETAYSDYRDQLRARVAESETKQAFVFIHGFNVCFEDAARRTAQMACDLAFDGAPIFFSWPSQGTFRGYLVDETNIEWATPDLALFLRQVSEDSGAETVHLIAHSMGNRALVRALEDIAATNRDSRLRFEEVILTAPDIDADVFARDIAPRL